ncbi:uncharacterized protein LOC121430726 [Lytechinus variegatus]|uniref:uncharacterized protein LOC121430726 n=1 Tax=Lytechinus variegatus TaxID=7654 RepID=UPI001BB0DF84|nr:uncharacterized protein LOC121430726 [Lytechinus variegatus]
MGNKEEDEESPFKSSTFNVLDALFVLISMGLLVADLVTDLIVTCKYFVGGDVVWGALTLGFVVIPSIILQVFSIRWYLVDDDMSSLKWITHIFQFGPLHRYVILFSTGIEARQTGDPLDFERLFYQQSDVCMLRLFESFMESAPQVVLQLYIMVATQDENFWTGTSAAVSLFSLCWALGAYSRAHRKVRRDKKIVSWPGLVLQTIWRIGMISSRVMALVLFASVFKAFIFLAVGIHWIGMLVWVHLQKTDFCTNALEERLFNCVVATIYVFCFFNLKEGKSRKRVLVFYFTMFVENTVLLLVWFNFRTVGEWYNVAGFTIVFGGYGIGVVSMVLYYRYLHPRNDFTLCGPKPEKEPSGSVNTTPSTSPSSSHAVLFSPELYCHGHSTSPTRHSDVNHNDDANSPLALPLSQTSININKEDGPPQRSRQVEGQDFVMGNGDFRKSKSESCMCYSEEKSVTVHLDKSNARNASVLMNASQLPSFRCDVSGFEVDLVQQYDDWRDHSRLTNHSLVSAGTKSGNMSQSLGSVLDKNHLSNGPSSDTSRMHVDPIPFSPDLQQMPEITDSPNKIMTAYEAQQIYDSILGIRRHDHPGRNSKRKLKFDDSGKMPGKTQSKTSDAVLHGKPVQNVIDSSAYCNTGPQRVTVTSKYVKDGLSVEDACRSRTVIESHALPSINTKDRHMSRERNLKIRSHHSQSDMVETEGKPIHASDDVKNDSETLNFQHLKTDMPRDFESTKPLQDSKDNQVINKECFQNQNKPSIPIVDENSAIDLKADNHIVSTGLRAALEKDLLKEKVGTRIDYMTYKCDMLDEGSDKTMPVLGCKMTSLIVHDEMPFGNHDKGIAVDPTESECFVHDKTSQDLQCTTSTSLLTSNNKTKEDHNINGKHTSSLDCKNTDKLGLGKENKMFQKGYNRDLCETDIPKEQCTRVISSCRSSSSLSKADNVGTSCPSLSGKDSPLVTGKGGRGGFGNGFQGRSPAGKTNLKRVRSLKGSVPPDAGPEGSSLTKGDSIKDCSDKEHGNRQEKTPIANLKGKLKRALSIKSRGLSENKTESSPSISRHLDLEPHPSDNHNTEKAVDTVEIENPKFGIDKALGHVGERAEVEKPVLVDKQQNKKGVILHPKTFNGFSQDIANHSPKIMGDGTSTSSPTTLSSSRCNEKRAYAPVLRTKNTSPQKNTENSPMYSRSLQKTGKYHISPVKGSQVVGKENRGFQQGTVKGTVSRLKQEKLGSSTGKKPPRRSLDRIPTNLVAANVAHFDSPNK